MIGLIFFGGVIFMLYVEITTAWQNHRDIAKMRQYFKSRA